MWSKRNILRLSDRRESKSKELKLPDGPVPPGSFCDMNRNYTIEFGAQEEYNITMCGLRRKDNVNRAGKSIF